MRVLERQPFSDDIAFPFSYDIEKTELELLFSFAVSVLLTFPNYELQYNTIKRVNLS